MDFGNVERIILFGKGQVMVDFILKLGDRFYTTVDKLEKAKQYRVKYLLSGIEQQ